MSASMNLNFLDLLQEFKAVGEFARFAGSAWTWRMTPRSGRPRPVLLIPGFLAGDATLYPFANWLRGRGHQVFFSGILANTDCPRRAIQRLERILRDLHERYGEKLVVIGHSLGGIYARELARRMPECVEQTVLLGTPIHEPERHAHPFVKLLATFTMRLHEGTRGCPGGLNNICGVHSKATPPDVPETIIFSKSDGVVDWVSCLESAPNVRTFEVDSTHCGLPYNLDTLRILHELIETDANEHDLA